MLLENRQWAEIYIEAYALARSKKGEKREVKRTAAEGSTMSAVEPTAIVSQPLFNVVEASSSGPGNFPI